MDYDDFIVYDIFRDNKPLTRVIDPKTGRAGTVMEIRETAPEWIEPFVRWDGETELKRHSGRLLLENPSSKGNPNEKL